ncbi:hypothetical protein [Roseimarinus sediminis]|uniref:hypothetical protein n=1 Tax=Roseimarinus sediminis TaxID=1610899 RepID=UPI003D23050C
MLLGIFFCFVFSVNANAQQTGRFYITGKVQVEQGITDGTTIQVFRDGGLLHTIAVNRTGNFRIGLELQHAYRFAFMKDDFYPKQIEINTHVPPEICEEDCEFPPYQITVMLYRKVPGVQSLSEETGQIAYNARIDNFDVVKLQEAKAELLDVRKILSEVKLTSENYEKQSKQNKQDQYQQLIKKANTSYQQKNYEAAMNGFRDALLIFPWQTAPRQMVSQMYEKMVEDELIDAFGAPSEKNFTQLLNYADQSFKEREYTVSKVAYNATLSIKPNDEQLKAKLYNASMEVEKLYNLAMAEVAHQREVYLSRSAKYKELTELGDKAFLQQNLADAREFYAQAATQIDENSLAILMVKKINELLTDDSLAQKMAKEKQAAEMERLRAARARAYNDAVEEADRLFNERMYRDAIEYYELALTVKDYEFYPKNQIRLINEILADLQLRGEEYNKLLRQAQEQMNHEAYQPARALYVEAHELIKDEKYALMKIKAIDELLAAEKEQEAVNRKYNDLISKADQQLDSKAYEAAISLYQEALTIKPREEYPNKQISLIRGILSREMDEQKRLAQSKRDFEHTIELADQAFDKESYEAARSLYQQALLIIPGQKYPLTQIDRIESILYSKTMETATSSALDQIDFSNLDNLSSGDREAAYNEAMSLGESFMKTEEWGIARFYFRRALALRSGDRLASEKIALVDQKIRGGSVDENQFREIIQKADEAYETGDFGVARFYYSKAKEIKSDDVYVNERLLVVSRLAQSTASRVANREYDTAIQKANEALTAKNYNVAKFFYRKALSIKPNDEVAQTKLEELERLIQQ